VFSELRGGWKTRTACVVISFVSAYTVRWELNNSTKYNRFSNLIDFLVLWVLTNWNDPLFFWGDKLKWSYKYLQMHFYFNNVTGFFHSFAKWPIEHFHHPWNGRMLPLIKIEQVWREKYHPGGPVWNGGLSKEFRRNQIPPFRWRHRAFATEDCIFPFRRKGLPSFAKHRFVFRRSQRWVGGTVAMALDEAGWSWRSRWNRSITLACHHRAPAARRYPPQN